jgi:putative ribosome biogenesis GTPase RsgA
LIGKIKRLCENGEGSVSVIEAEAGMGKSTLINELQRLAKNAFGKKITVMKCVGNEAERLTSYYAFRYR